MIIAVSALTKPDAAFFSLKRLPVEPPFYKRDLNGSPLE